MLSEEKVREIYDIVDNLCKEKQEEMDGLFSKVSDMVTAEWAVDRQRRLNQDYNVWNNVRHQLARVLEINETEI